MKIGDRVTRRPVNNFKYKAGQIGTIIKPVDFSRWENNRWVDYPRWYIKWDEKASTGQQHSTLQEKFLELAP